MTLEFQQCGMCTHKGSDQPAHTRSLIRGLCYSLEYSMTVKLLTEQRLEFLSLKGGCTCQNTTLLETTFAAHISKAVLKCKV